MNYIEVDWTDVRDTARLLSEIHQLSNNELRPQREFLKRQIMSVDYLNEEQKEDVIRTLDRLPRKNQICHGDPNPNNLLISSGGPVLIDWNDAASVSNPESGS